HRVRAAEDGQAAPLLGEGREIERPVELMTLDANESHKGLATRSRLEETQIVETRLDVLVDRVNLEAGFADPLPRKAREIATGAVGQEAPAEAFAPAVRSVFARFDEDDAKRSGGGHRTS